MSAGVEEGGDKGMEKRREEGEQGSGPTNSLQQCIVSI